MFARKFLLGAVLAIAVVGLSACSAQSRTNSGGPAGRPPAAAAVVGDFVGQRVTVGQPTVSMECYSFDSSGYVELRHGDVLSDTGTYRGGGTGGTVAWDSGRTSTVAASGGQLVVNGLRLTPIASCT